jgi:PAS domain S-box-containing protein
MISGLLGPLPSRNTGRYGIRSVIGLLVVLAVVGFGIGEVIVGQRADTILAAARHRAEVILQNRADLIRAWLPRWLDATAPLRGNPMIRVFAATATSQGLGSSVDPDLIADLQGVLDDFASRRVEVAAAYMLDADGRAFLASSHGPHLDETLRRQAQDVTGTGTPRIGALRASEDGLVYDVFMPVFPDQATSPAAAARPVATLMLMIRAGAGLAEALAPGRTLEADENLVLLQALPGGGSVAANAKAENLNPLAPAILASASQFGIATLQGRERYLLSEPVPQTAWQLLYDIDAASVRGDIVATRLVVSLLILAALGCVGAGVLVVWWRQSLHNSLALAEQYRDFAARLEAQHQLLNSINDTIAEEITVVDANRRIVYANTAFAEHVDRDPRGCTGEAIHHLLTPELARRFAEWDARVLKGESMVGQLYEDREGATPRWLAISKVPFTGADGTASGVVTLVRDVTEAQIVRERQRQTMEDTIRVLSRSVAAADPYLANHADRLRELAVEIAREMGCTAAEIDTIGTAASLSQIGKIFLPRELIRKETRLTPDQRQKLNAHIDLALEAVRGIAFELPVPQTLEQIHERLDGSGYPRGRSGAEITRLGRILAVADVFAARTAPRSYREAISSEKMLEIFREHPEKYDLEVVDVLARIAPKTAGVEEPGVV